VTKKNTQKINLNYVQGVKKLAIVRLSVNGKLGASINCSVKKFKEIFSRDGCMFNGLLALILYCETKTLSWMSLLR